MSWVAEAAAFFTALEADNTRERWQRERGRYDDVLRPAFVSLVEALPGWGAWRVYRPHNDSRFGAAPYKTFLGAVTERADGVGAFVQVGPRGLLTGTGVPMAAPDQLARLRSALQDEAAGGAFDRAVETVRALGARVHGGRWEPLKRLPSGVPQDAPRGEWLRCKGLEVTQRPGTPDWADGPDAVPRLASVLEVGAPLHDWLAAHVGATALTPEERFAPRRRTASG